MIPEPLTVEDAAPHRTAPHRRLLFVRGKARFCGLPEHADDSVVKPFGFRELVEGDATVMETIDEDILQKPLPRPDPCR
ncbi:MAG: hypothetical protein ACI9AO_002051 [Ilumatobacter sp.]